MDNETLVNLLTNSKVSVKFKKKDGSERVMVCTLNSDMVKSYEKKTERVKQPNTEVCPVFDVEKQEWRSFRFDSVISAEVV